MEINSQEAIDRTAKRLHEQAEAIRAKEKQIKKQHADGIAIEEICEINKCTRKYVECVLRAKY